MDYQNRGQGRSQTPQFNSPSREKSPAATSRADINKGELHQYHGRGRSSTPRSNLPLRGKSPAATFRADSNKGQLYQYRGRGRSPIPRSNSPLRGKSPAASSRADINEGELYKVFQHIDIDGSGYVDVNEFKVLLRFYGYRPEVIEQNAVKWFLTIDPDRSGHLYFDEFLQVLKENGIHYPIGPLQQGDVTSRVHSILFGLVHRTQITLASSLDTFELQLQVENISKSISKSTSVMSNDRLGNEPLNSESIMALRVCAFGVDFLYFLCMCILGMLITVVFKDWEIDFLFTLWEMTGIDLTSILAAIESIVCDLSETSLLVGLVAIEVLLVFALCVIASTGQTLGLMVCGLVFVKTSYCRVVKGKDSDKVVSYEMDYGGERLNRVRNLPC
jgi:hypothetical protein